MIHTQPEAGAVLGEYLDLMDTQRENMFSQLKNISQDQLWHRPQPEEWSIGENIDHLRVIYTSALTFFKFAWFFLYPLAYLRRDETFQAAIDNVYRRPGFPQNVGWIWPPKYTPNRPIPFSELKQGLVGIHRQVRAFYTSKHAGMLGNLPLYDPAIGWINMIQGLRVGIYHDEMHFGEIQSRIIPAAPFNK
jgi:hypothetical protein